MSRTAAPHSGVPISVELEGTEVTAELTEPAPTEVACIDAEVAWLSN